MTFIKQTNPFQKLYNKHLQGKAIATNIVLELHDLFAIVEPFIRKSRIYNINAYI
jgi:hypothetical protein